jgi:hypothetical protein
MGVENGEPTREASRAERFGDVLSILYRDATGLLQAPFRWRRETLVGWGIFSAGLALAYGVDEEIRESIRGDAGDGLRRVEPYIEPFGGNDVSQGISLGIYLLGAIADDDDLEETGVIALESAILTGAFVGLLKESIGRARPFDERGRDAFDSFSGATSFPSNHAAQAFSLAAVISSRHDKRAGLFLYPCAAAIGLSRMAEDLHWGSDVLAGAVIGTLVGLWLARPVDFVGESAILFPAVHPRTGFRGVGISLLSSAGRNPSTIRRGESRFRETTWIIDRMR